MMMECVMWMGGVLRIPLSLWCLWKWLGFRNLCLSWKSAPPKKHTFSKLRFTGFADLRVLRTCGPQSCGPVDLRSCGSADLRICGPEFLKILEVISEPIWSAVYCEDAKILRLCQIFFLSGSIKWWFCFVLVGPPSSATSVGGSFDTRPTAGIHCAIPLLKRKSF